MSSSPASFPSGPAAAISTAGDRIGELDVLRGFALCGILVVNVIQQLVWFRGTGPRVFPGAVTLLFSERFLSIFALLFGVGFGLFLQRAGGRAARPRLVLARRLLVLLVIGAVHFVFHRGEVLTSYAVVGLLVLLPLSHLRGRAALAVAIVLLFVGPQVQTGFGLIPGLLALGYALALLGVPEALHRRTGRIALALLVTGAAAAVWWSLAAAGVRVGRVNVLGGGLGGIGDIVAPAAAVATGVAYCCVVLLVLRTPLGPVVDAVLAPMGRMALTNYLGATALFLTLGPVLGIDSFDDTAAIAGLTVGILVVQAVWSPIWLRFFRYGPVEWVWRCLTWLRWAPLRRRPTTVAA